MDVQGHLLDYDLEQPTRDDGFWRGFPQAGCEADDPRTLLRRRALPRPVLPPERHLARRAVGGADRRTGQSAVDRRDGAHQAHRPRPLPRRAGAAPRPGEPQRRVARAAARVDGRARRRPPDHGVEGVHARAGARLVPRRPRPRGGAGRRGVPAQGGRDPTDRVRAQGAVGREPVRHAGGHRPGRQGPPRHHLRRVPLGLRDEDDRGPLRAGDPRPGRQPARGHASRTPASGRAGTSTPSSGRPGGW